MVSVLFVCLGNICRSPAAEGVFRALCLREGLSVSIDSAGTGAWHAGNLPDMRMRAAAKNRGIDLSKQRARQVQQADYRDFDLILAMDQSNLADLLAEAPPNRTADIRLFLDFGSSNERDVPDPYYGGDAGFEKVLNLVEDAALGLLQHLEDNAS